MKYYIFLSLIIISLTSNLRFFKNDNKDYEYCSLKRDNFEILIAKFNLTELKSINAEQIFQLKSFKDINLKEYSIEFIINGKNVIQHEHSINKIKKGETKIYRSGLGWGSSSLIGKTVNWDIIVKWFDDNNNVELCLKKSFVITVQE